jgi:hypothetical protein
VLFARAEDESVISGMIAGDPYNINGAASYEVIEMNPVLWTDTLEGLFAAK